jgi:hypothetical protein
MNTINTNNLSLAILVLQVAQGQVGQAENPKGSNSGPMVNKYLEATGLQPGYAWCQAFVYWCYNEVARHLARSNPVVKTASVTECWNKTAAKRKIAKAAAQKTPELLQPGQQFILLFGNNTGHTGIIERIENTKAGIVLHTIEGNSNEDGGREGYAVVRHLRKLEEKALAGFIRYT